MSKEINLFLQKQWIKLFWEMGNLKNIKYIGAKGNIDKYICKRIVFFKWLNMSDSSE